MSSNGKKPFDFKEAQARQAAKPKMVAEIKVTVFDNNQVLVTRPEGDSPENLAAVMDLLATGIKIVAQKMAGQKEAPRIVMLPPGARLNR